MVIVCCPSHLPPTQTILCPTQPHSEPKQAHPDGRVILVSNWVQPIGGTDCRSETGERKLVGRRGGRGGHFILHCQLAADEAPAGPTFPRTGGLEGQLLFRDVDLYQTPEYQRCFFLMSSAISCSWYFTIPYWFPLLCLLSHK